MKFSIVVLALSGFVLQSIALGDTAPKAEAREPDLKQLDLLQEIFSNPNVDDNKIIAAMKNFDKAPIDKSIKDLSNILKLLVTEQQLSHQSLRIISIAMDKLSQRTNGGQESKPTRTRRDVLPQPVGKRTGIEEFGSYESFGDLGRPRQKRYSYHAVGALALLALASSPYLWGGPWGFGGPWAYRYGYPGYYPGYVPVAGTPAAAAAKK